MENLKKVIGETEANGLVATDSIVKILALYGNNDGQLHWIHRHKIQEYVRKGEPVRLLLPAFPAKSPNREKTFSHLPDFAEVLGLIRLNRICEDIRLVYSPGASVLICSDGRIFGDLVGVGDDEVTSYRESLETIIKERQLLNLATFHLEDAFAHRDFPLMRETVVKSHGPALTTLREQAKECPHTLSMVNGIHRFLTEDQATLHPHLSRNQLRKVTRNLAYEVVQRSKSWSSFVENEYPGAVRLSIHPQGKNSTKIGIRLVEAEDRWATPWHNVAFFDGRGYLLLPRREAEARGRLDFAYGKFAFFRAEGK